MIKIFRTERIQDGVVRLEFVAGEAAIDYVEKQENQLNTISRVLGASKEKVVESLRKSVDDADETKRKLRAVVRKTLPSVMNSIFKDAKVISSDGIKLFSIHDEELGEDYYISLGETATQNDPYLIFVALIGKGQGCTCHYICWRIGEKKDQGRRYSPTAFADPRRIRGRK